MFILQRGENLLCGRRAPETESGDQGPVIRAWQISREESKNPTNIDSRYR